MPLHPPPPPSPLTHRPTHPPSPLQCVVALSLISSRSSESSHHTPHLHIAHCTARDDIPHIEVYPDGQTLPTPESEGPKPGTLLGCVSGELGLREFLESRGHELVVVNDKDGQLH